MVFILYLSGNHDKSYLHYRSSCYHYGRMTGSFWVTLRYQCEPVWSKD